MIHRYNLTAIKIFNVAFHILIPSDFQEKQSQTISKKKNSKSQRTADIRQQSSHLLINLGIGHEDQPQRKNTTETVHLNRTKSRGNKANDNVYKPSKTKGLLNGDSDWNKNEILNHMKKHKIRKHHFSSNKSEVLKNPSEDDFAKDFHRNSKGFQNIAVDKGYATLDKLLLLSKHHFCTHFEVGES